VLTIPKSRDREWLVEESTLSARFINELDTISEGIAALVLMVEIDVLATATWMR